MAKLTTTLVERDVGVVAGTVLLAGTLTIPPEAGGMVFFAHGSGSSRSSPRNRFVARRLNEAGLATLLFDLLTEREAAERTNVFDVDLLGRRLVEAIDWHRGQAGLEGLPVGVFGASTGAAAALIAAARLPGTVRAVVSRGGRPDLAGDALGRVLAPTLLLVGGEDDLVLELNQAAIARLASPKRLVVIPGAGHLFEEPGKLEAVSRLAAEWFVRYLTVKRLAE